MAAILNLTTGIVYVRSWSGTMPGGTLAVDTIKLDSTNQDVILVRDAANTLALRNGTNAQRFKVYNTYTSSTNNEFLDLNWAGNIAYVYANKGSGGGSSRELSIGTIGSRNLNFNVADQTRWYVEGTTGNLKAATDNSYDIGASGANRPRTIYAGSSIFSGASLVANGRVYPNGTSNGVLMSTANGKFSLLNSAETAGVLLDVSTDSVATFRNRADSGYASVTAGFYRLGASGFLQAAADGVFQVINNGSTGFTRLILGTNDTSGVSIKKNSTNFQFRLGDDSDWATVSSAYVRSGSGSPEGVVTAAVGTLYSRTDGGAGTSFYVKESGSGNTGWIAK